MLIFSKSVIRKLKKTPGSGFGLKMEIFGGLDWLEVSKAFDKY